MTDLILETELIHSACETEVRTTVLVVTEDGSLDSESG